MTLEECYTQLHGDYATALSRLMNERLVDKFIRKFPADNTILQLRDAIKDSDRDAAFAAAHTIKGVAANLSFTELQHTASELTEQLRDGVSAPDQQLAEAVFAAYDRVISVLNQYME